MGRYSGRDTTPALDAWLEESVVLDNHRSCSNWTYPSFVCVYTGAYGEDLGVYPHGIDTYPDEPETLAEMMNDRGYATRMEAAQFVLDPVELEVAGTAEYVVFSDVRHQIPERSFLAGLPRPRRSTAAGARPSGVRALLSALPSACSGDM